MKKTITSILMLLLCFVMTACIQVNKLISKQRADKEKCTLNQADARRFNYKDTEYLILADTVDNSELGEWVGYIQKLAVLDQSYRVLEEQAIELALPDLKDISHETTFIVPFNNVYLYQEDQLIIDVNGNSHVAIPADKSSGRLAISYTKVNTSPGGTISINPDNCTQLLYGEKIYQITEIPVDAEKIEQYLGIIAREITFDAVTKREISQSDLKTIEIAPGELSAQNRAQWSYMEVYTIQGIDPGSTFAVEINNQYVQAVVVE